MKLIVGVLALSFATIVFGQTDARDREGDEVQKPSARDSAGLKEDASRLPKQELTESILLGLLLAEVAAQRENPGYAARTYVELAKRTADPRIAERAVEIANQARLPNLALDAARTWYKAEPESGRALQALSGLLIGARRVEEAEPYLAKLFAADRATASNGFMQINRFLSVNPDRNVNLAVVRKLASAYPDLPQARFAIAQAAAGAEDDAVALEEIRRAAELKPDWDIAAMFEAQLLQHKAPADAMARLAGYLKNYPGSREVGLNYARILVFYKKLPEARAQFKALLTTFPDNVEIMYSVGLMSVQLKDYDAAEEYLIRLLQTGFRDKGGLRYMLGQVAEEKKDYPAALRWYSQIESGDQFIPSKLRTAQIIYKQGNLEEARAFLRKVDAGDQKVKILIAEAQLLREASQNDEAFKLLNQALEAEPGQPELLYDRAMTAEKLERYDILEADLNALIKARPDHAHAYNALGYSFADRNIRLDEARKLIEKAVALAPDDMFIVDSLGWVLYRMGDLPGAVEQLRRAWQGRPDGEIGAHLGEVLWIMGKRDEADRIWQEAVKNSPDNDALKKTIKRFKNP